MKYITKIAAFCLPLWLLAGTSVYAQTYANLWKQVESAEKKGLPKTAKEATEKIYRKAESEGNFPWLIRSYAELISLSTEVSVDSFNVNIEYLEKLAAEKKGTCDAAVLHTILGKAYNDMKFRFYNDADTYEKYDRLSNEHYTMAMADKELLANTQTKDYVPLVTVHTDSKLYNNDMLSVIAVFVANHRNITTDDRYAMYDSLSTFYAERGNRNAALLTKLEALGYQRYISNREKRISESQYKDTLLKMAEENKDIEAGADVYFKLLSSWHWDEQEKLDVARKAMKLYPNSIYTTTFKQKETEVFHPALHVYSDVGYTVGTPCPIYVVHRNIGQSTLTLTDKKTGKVVERMTVTHKKSIEQATDTVYMTIPKAGKYVFRAESNGKSGKCDINVTSLRLFAIALPDKTLQCTVADNSTGRPVKGCTVKAEYWNTQTKKPEFLEGHTDSLGVVSFDHHNWRSLYASRNSDDVTENTYIGYLGYDNSAEQAQLSISVFTDRSIYRPGQTVKAMLLAYDKEGDRCNVAKQKEFTLTLHDANGKEVSSKTVTSNSMGTASAEFVIPKGRLNGDFSITTSEGGRCAFKVEEYKRPTFSVEMNVDGNSEEQEANREYSFGDTLEIRGKAMTLSGVEVQGAKVKYTIEFSNRFFWYGFGTNWQFETDGELTTDENGAFSIPIYLNRNRLQEGNLLLDYRITTEVTDLGGETQRGEYILPVSKEGFGLSLNMPRDIDKNNVPELKVMATNARGKNIDIEGKWMLYRISSKAKTDNPKTVAPYNTKEQTLVAEGSFVSGKPIDTSCMKGLAPGSYTIKVSATDNRQNKIEAESRFVLFDIHAERMEVTEDWLYASSKDFGPGNPVDIYFMPKKDDVYLYYYVLANDRMVEKGHRVSTGNIQHFHFDYKEEYGEAISLQLFYVKDGKTYSEKKDITLKAPEKKLTLTWKTFRDKLQPGQKEEWTLSVSDAEGKPAFAELAAVLYDGALDKLSKHGWDFDVHLFRRVPMVRLVCGYSNLFNSVYVDYPMPKFNLKTRSFSMLTSGIIGYRRMNTELKDVKVRSYGTRNVFATSAAQPLAGKIAGYEGVAEAMLDVTEDAAVVEEAEMSADAGASEAPDPAQPLRSNFAETAFFYPHLMTDEKGDVAISFTLPESLTEWKFIGLAHTEDVDYGKITAEITARKEFMVQPNMPRFVRVGDKVSIATKIINQTENMVSGTAVMELTDPETEKTVYKSAKKFSVDKDGTASVQFDFSVSDKYPLLVCRISAGNKTFSDGERNYLPVLTNKKHITETIPFFMDSTGTKRIDLSGMFNNGSSSATDKQMTIEYSDNPGWTVIQSLKSLSEANNNDAISRSAALYANSAIQMIAANNPSMQQMVETWKNSGASANSPLTENEELKDILLQESPWMAEAENETEQMMKFADLFDQNAMEGRIAADREKLISLQNADGSWSWFNGMEGNYHVTATVVEQLAELEKLAGNNRDIHDILIKGCKYLDQKELETYRRMKKEKKDKQKIVISESTMRYLYISSLIERSMSSEVKQMQREYIEKIGEDINALTIYGRANIATVLNAGGKGSLAKDFVKSLREYTVYKADMGRYYDTDRAQYSWMDYRIPTHIASMKAMRMMHSEFSDTDDYLNNMTLWLIRQKQTQCWDNPINTVNAVNELLQADRNIVWHETAEATFTLNGKKIDGTVGKKKESVHHTSTLPGGYRKMTVPEKLIGKENELTVSKASSGISWGAVYGQYVEDFDKLSNSSGSLTVSRKIYKEVVADGKKNWQEVTEGSTLAVGEKIRIRHIITADRDMDFVQVHSQLPACIEPVNPLSGYRRLSKSGGIGWTANGCYTAVHDASTDFFFDTFRKGTTTIDFDVFVSRKGSYSSGIATVQCAYSSEFAGHSGSHRIEVK